MRNRSTKFREDWLVIKDGNNTVIKEWCVKGKDDFSAYCFLCKATVNIENGGKTQLIQHANTKKHKLTDSARKDSSQSRLISIPGTKGFSLNKLSNSDAKHPWAVTEDDKLCQTEILWILHVAISNYSFSSCDSIKNLFIEMFPDSSLPQGIQLSPRKISYAISHGLGPYFLKQISDEFEKETPFFTLMYDETLNEQNLKQLDLHVRYWNSKEHSISEHYIGTELMGHATALDISGNIKSILKYSKIDLKRLLMLGSDGPNVNKAVFKIFDNDVKLIRDFGLINVGTCNLHIVHNGFGAGIKIESFTNIVDFLENIHSWFSKFPSRQEDLQKNMENFGHEFSKVLRYVSNRWLSVVKVCERTLYLLPSLKVYFLEDLAKDKKNKLIKTNRYECIKKILDAPLTPVYLHFLISVGSLFEHFLQLLQTKSTLIHLLHDELIQLISKLLRRFVKEDVIKKKKGEDLCEIDLRKEALSAKKVDIGNNAKKHLATLPEDLKSQFFADAKEFYVIVATYLCERLPLKNVLLQSLKILHPLVRKEPINASLPSLRRLATLLPIVIPEDCVDKLTDEWRLYTCDADIQEEWGLENNQWKSIDFFWGNIFKLLSNDSEARYPYLATLVKAVLSFSHGQASNERGFSINKRMLTSERSCMSIDTIRGIRLIKDAVQGKATNACITKEMTQFYKESYSKYNAQKESEQLKKKKDQQKVSNPSTRNPTEKESHKDKLLRLKQDISSAQAMINEGNQRLKTGLKRKCMQEIETAQTLIDAGNKKLKIANDEIDQKNA